MYVRLIGLLFLWLVSDASGTVYRWENNKGEVFFADEWTKIPSEYQSRARKLKSSPKPPSSPPAVKKPRKSDRHPQFEQKTDARGNGKKWWRDLKKKWEKKKKTAEDKMEALEFEIRQIQNQNDIPKEMRAKEIRKMKRQHKAATTQRDLATQMMTHGIPEEAKRAGVPDEWLRVSP